MKSLKTNLLSYSLLLFLVIIGLSGVSNAQNDKKKDYIVPVLTTKAKVGEIKETLKYNGTIYSMNSVNISAKIGGQITNIYYDEGDMVKAGDVLLKIDDNTIALRLKQAEEGVTAASQMYQKIKSSIKLEEEQIDLQISMATSNLDAAKAVYEKMKAGARPEEKNQAEAAMFSAEAAMKNSEANFLRMEELFNKKTVSKQQYDLSKMEYDVAKAQYEIAKESHNLVQAGMRAEDIKASEANYLSAQTAVKIAESLKLKLEILKNDLLATNANLKQAEYEKKIAGIMLDDTLVRATSDGVISKKFAEEGEVIQAPGIPLFKLLDQRSMKVKVNIPESDIAKIAHGQAALIETDSFPNKNFVGNITKLSATVDIRLRTLEVEITVSNDEGLLREGMFAKVTIFTAVHKDAVYIPINSVDEKDGEKFVFIAKGDSTEKKNITTGIVQGDVIEIISGISGGEEVISRGNLQLEEGMKIRIENRE